MVILRKLVDFYDLMAYERRMLNDVERLKHELKYCQDLLVDEATNDNITQSRQGEINAYVAHIKENRELEKRFREKGWFHRGS